MLFGLLLLGIIIGAVGTWYFLHQWHQREVDDWCEACEQRLGDVRRQAEGGNRS
ncbi:MAG: hypothetical protein ACFB6S_13630 [Geminicoccaceae bacterium]